MQEKSSVIFFSIPSFSRGFSVTRHDNLWDSYYCYLNFTVGKTKAQRYHTAWPIVVEPGFKPGLDLTQEAAIFPPFMPTNI